MKRASETTANNKPKRKRNVQVDSDTRDDLLLDQEEVVASV